MLVGAFQADEGGFTLEKLRALNSEAARSALWNSILLSASTAVIGAVLGRCWPTSWSRVGPPASFGGSCWQCGVLAQFGV